MTHTIVKFGPIEKENGAFFTYYVFPGIPDEDEFYAADDHTALDKITCYYDKGQLTCDPAMEEAASNYGIPIGELPPQGKNVISMAALDYLPGLPFQKINVDELMVHFVESVSKFQQHWQAREKNLGAHWFHVAVRGTVAFDTLAVVEIKKGIKHQLVLSLEKFDPDATFDVGQLLQANHIKVESRSKPSFILEALQKAASLPFIPFPSITVRGKKQKLADMQLAILMTVYFALSQFEVDTESTFCQYALESYKVETTLTALEVEGNDSRPLD